MKCTKCDLQAVGRGLCSTHYGEARRYSKATGKPMPNKNREVLAFTGKWPKVRLRLTPLDVLGMRGSTFDQMPTPR